MSRYKFSDLDFIEAVRTSFSIRETLHKLGLAPVGGAYRTFYIRVKRLNIDTSHFTGQGHLKNKNHNWSSKISLDQLLTANSSKVLGAHFKKRLLAEGFLKNICYKCGLKDFWCGQPIVLHIDHINGDHFDHRLENLRLLCPNCHSQTPTYCSKNFEIKYSKIKNGNFVPQERIKCLLCNKELKDNRSTYCIKCYNGNRRKLQSSRETATKIIWPSLEELESKLKNMSYAALGRELGVSDNAIRKHIQNQKLKSSF